MSGRHMGSIWQLPEVPAVYALHGGGARENRLVFVGVAESLLERLVEQLVIPNLRHHSPTAILFMQPGYVREIRWWEHPRFADGNALRAGEFVASEVLQPLYSSMRPSSNPARALSIDADFREAMASLFRRSPSGTLVLATLDDLVERLERIEQRLSNDAD